MCGKEFDEDLVNKKILSLLTRSLIITCPYCSCNSVNLTNKGKLLIERRAKINKIENDRS